MEKQWWTTPRENDWTRIEWRRYPQTRWRSKDWSYSLFCMLLKSQRWENTYVFTEKLWSWWSRYWQKQRDTQELWRSNARFVPCSNRRCPLQPDQDNHRSSSHHSISTSPWQPIMELRINGSHRLSSLWKEHSSMLTIFFLKDKPQKQHIKRTNASILSKSIEQPVAFFSLCQSSEREVKTQSLARHTFPALSLSAR